MQEAHNFITIVSGLPRSGTSLMMQMLAAGGLPTLTDERRAADASNPRGYLEFEPVKHLRTDRTWLPSAVGHTVKIIHLLLRELPTDGGFTYRVLLMKRPIAEVLASQRVMLERQGKPSAHPSILTPVYQAQLAQAEQWLRDQPDFSFLPIEYHRVIQTPATVAQEVTDFLGSTLDVVKMAAAVDPALHRQRLS